MHELEDLSCVVVDFLSDFNVVHAQIVTKTITEKKRILNLLLQKFTDLGLNEKVFTREDFFEICLDEGVEIIWHDGDESWYMEVAGKAYISLSNALEGYDELFTMFHELAHHFCHGGRAPELALFNCVKSSKDEFEANAVAVLAICPEERLLSGELNEEAETDPVLRAILKLRMKLLLDYGI